MNKLNNLIKMTAVAVAVVLLAGCGGGSGSGDKQYQIAILQFMAHPALDSARQGFIDQLADEGFVEGQNVRFVTHNPQGDISVNATMAQQIVDTNPDLVLSIATPSSQALRNATMDNQNLPIVFTAITNPLTAGLVESFERPNTNMTGCSDLYPVEYLFNLMLRILPDVKTVGIMYNSSEANSEIQANMAAETLTRMGLEYVRATVTGTVDVAQIAETLVSRVDVVYTPTCNTMASAMAQLVRVAHESAGIPVLAAERGGVENGALASEGIDYYQLGRQTGVMAAQILRGEIRPQDMPVQYQSAERTGVFINTTTAERLNITIPAEILANAQIFN